MTATALPLLLALSASAAPDGLPAAAAPGAVAELRARLDALAARAPVRATFTHRFEGTSGSGKGLVRLVGAGAGTLEEDADGLRISWARPQLDAARAEERRRAADADAPAPTREAMAALPSNELAAYLDAASLLRLQLEGARVLQDRADTLDGAPARLLVLRVDPPLGPRERRYVKQLDATAWLWLGEDGIPRAAERRVSVSGRALLVVTFEQQHRDVYRFELHGDRLVTVRHESERQGSSAGDPHARASLTTLAVEP